MQKTAVVKSASGGTSLVTLAAVSNTGGSIWRSTSAALDIRPTGTEVVAITNDIGTVSTLALPAVAGGALRRTARPAA